ncbi:MAG TPA: VCBS repeat-containing protein [Chitinophagaceae bacterium]|nr:VCBS repeat-containing protein [Chitinophagaceae bacterium]
MHTFFYRTLVLSISHIRNTGRLKSLVIIFVGACIMQKAHAQQTLFQLLPPSATGINFTNNIKETESLNVLNYEYLYNGGGVAVGDINNDGLEDLFFTGNMQPNKLYLNMGNMQFKDITADANKELEGRRDGWKTGVTMADVNGDGLLDIYICYSGKNDPDQRRNQLFINAGNNKFVEKAKEYGLDNPGYSTQAAFFDYDNDGDLDMFLLNHAVSKIDNADLAKYRVGVDEMAGNKLFENQGGHFVDVTNKAGIHQFPLTFGLGVAIADVNKDGWQDIYVTNDYNEPDYLYINNHDGTFTEKSRDYFRYISQFSMGTEIADFNNDGLPDFVTLDMLPEDNRRQKILQLQENYDNFQLMLDEGLYKQYMRNMLQVNNGDGTFSEIGQLAGMSNTDWSWCPLLADFDNDGYKDLLITNGYLRDYTNKDFLRYRGDYKVKKAIDREPESLMEQVNVMPSTKLANYIFRNNHNLTFSNVQSQWGLQQASVSSGAVYADLDNDGDLDIVIANVGDKPFVYKNLSRENNGTSYIAIKLTGAGANTNAIGAKIMVYTDGMQQYQEVNPNRGYLSRVSTTAHFGLGHQTKNIDSIRITWPDNKTTLLRDVKINQLLAVHYGDNTNNNVSPLQQPTLQTIFTGVKAVIPYTNQSYDENDFKRQPLMLFMYSKTSPVTAVADVNKDGLEDIFISGDKNKPGKVYLQQKNGGFLETKGVIGNEDISAVASAAFADVNGDGYPDLYVAKGGYSLFEPNTPSLQDELYLNDGKGNFVASPNALPDVSTSAKSCVRACDFDGDGDIDFFVGGHVIPGQYPVTPQSYLLVNNGKGRFTIADVPFANAGMVTDARWADINKDGRPDLIMCGEMMPIKIYINTPQGFVDKTADYFDANIPLNGFWFSLNITDVNGDGDLDIIAGNLGLNTQIKATAAQPATMYYDDFDNNGTIDPFFNFYINDTRYPYVSRDELIAQMNSMRRKFPSYSDYADATMDKIFSPEELQKAGKLTVNEMKTMCYINHNGKFAPVGLPLQAQFSMVTNIITGDFNGDGFTDILLLGNHSDNRLKLGAFDANYGTLLKGNGKGGFEYVPQPVSGLSVKGDVKSASILTVAKKQNLVIGINNAAMQFYEMRDLKQK